jgi:hypothetical protein
MENIKMDLVEIVWVVWTGLTKFRKWISGKLL